MSDDQDGCEWVNVPLWHAFLVPLLLLFVESERDIILGSCRKKTFHIYAQNLVQRLVVILYEVMSIL